MNALQRLLVATDFSPSADAAAALAAQLARRLPATLHVMTMVDTSAVRDAAGDAAFRAFRIGEMLASTRQRLQAFAERHFAGLEPVHLEVVDGGADPDPCADILRAGTQLGCDLIVLGTHGRSGLDHLVFGSVAEKVVRSSAIPTLTVRAPSAPGG
jgi:nucleotide-binding universal stress UspA family protein